MLIVKHYEVYIISCNQGYFTGDYIFEFGKTFPVYSNKNIAKSFRSCKKANKKMKQLANQENNLYPDNNLFKDWQITAIQRSWCVSHFLIGMGKK